MFLPYSGQGWQELRPHHELIIHLAAVSKDSMVCWHWQIARMLTIRRERELERGVTLRESRKLDRQWKRSIVIRPPPSYAASLAEQEKK